jgi:hypothetical protein
VKIADLIRILSAFPSDLDVWISYDSDTAGGPVIQVRSQEAQVGEEIKEVVLISDNRI